MKSLLGQFRVQLLLSSVVPFFLLAAASSLYGLNVSVQGPPGPPIRIQQKARILVRFHGEAMVGVKVGVWNEGRQYGGGAESSAVVSLVTGEDASVTLPELPPGRYYIGLWRDWPQAYDGFDACIIPCPRDRIETADAPTALIAESLHGPFKPIDRDASALNEIWVDLGLKPDSGQARLLSTEEQLPIEDRMTEFRGVVQDPSGAVIPGAQLEIWVKGTGAKKHAALLFSDSVGGFSARLADGNYIALIAAPGFRTRVVVFTIAPTGTENELHVALEVGSTTETVTLSALRQKNWKRISATDLRGKDAVFQIGRGHSSRLCV